MRHPIPQAKLLQNGKLDTGNRVPRTDKLRSIESPRELLRARPAGPPRASWRNTQSTPQARLGTIPAKTVTALTAELSNMTIENDARRIVQENIKRLRDMGTYRGRRHAMGLPVRGQRTRTQIETAKKLNTLERGGTGSRF